MLHIVAVPCVEAHIQVTPSEYRQAPFAIERMNRGVGLLQEEHSRFEREITVAS